MKEKKYLSLPHFYFILFFTRHFLFLLLFVNLFLRLFLCFFVSLYVCFFISNFISLEALAHASDSKRHTQNRVQNQRIRTISDSYHKGSRIAGRKEETKKARKGERNKEGERGIKLAQANPWQGEKLGEKREKRLKLKLRQN